MDQLAWMKSMEGKPFSTSPSPFMHWLKPVIVKAEKGSLTLRYTVRKDMTNPIGILHGGVTAAIIDDLMGATLFSLNEAEFFTTINNVIDYFASARPGDEIIAETQIIKKGKTIANMQCEVWLADKSKMIARGYSNLMKLEPRNP